MKIKTSLLILSAIVSITFFSSCGAIKEKLAEKAVEKVIEKSTGNQVDIKKDGAKVSNNSGSYESGENLKWPKDQMGDLPEPKAKFVAILNDAKTKGCSVGFASCEIDDAKKYIDELKKRGYASSFETVDKESMVYIGTKTDGAVANFTYSVGSKDGLIAYNPPGTVNIEKANPTATPSPSAAAPNNSKPTPTAAVDMTDAAPWPGNFLKGVPELNGKIISVDSTDEVEKIVILEYVEKTDIQKFIEVLKTAGYTNEKEESSSQDFIQFSAYNQKEDRVDVYWDNSKAATVTMQKSE